MGRRKKKKKTITYMETAPNESAYLKLTMKGSEEELNEIKTMLEEFLTGRAFRVVVFPKFMKRGPKNRKKGAKNETDGAQVPNERPKKRKNQRFKKVRKNHLKQQDGGNDEQQGGFRRKKRRNPRPTEQQQQQPLGQTRTRMRRRPKHPKSAIQQQQPQQRQQRPQQQQQRQQNQRNPQQQQRNPQSTGRRQQKGQRKGFRQRPSQQSS